MCKRLLFSTINANTALAIVTKAEGKVKFFLKWTDYTYTYNDLTNFEYVVLDITGNGSYLNLKNSLKHFR